MMKRFLLPLLLAIITLLSQAPAPVMADSVSTMLERRVFYQFNAKRSNPRHTDRRLEAVRFRGLILWVAQPKPGEPTILYLPGSSGNLGTRGKKFPWFLDRGYGLIAMAYPGMGGSKGRPSRKRIQDHANMLYEAVPDLVGKGRTIIMGESLGTGVALGIATSSAGRKRPPLGIIFQAPYTSLVDLVAVKQPKMLRLFKSRNDLWPSKNMIRHTRVPIFIMHGSKDKRVPFKMGKTLFGLSPSPNKVFVTHPSAGHTSIWRKETTSRLHKWIERLK